MGRGGAAFLGCRVGGRGCQSCSRRCSGYDGAQRPGAGAGGHCHMAGGDWGMLGGKTKRQTRSASFWISSGCEGYPVLLFEIEV